MSCKDRRKLAQNILIKEFCKLSTLISSQQQMETRRRKVKTLQHLFHNYFDMTRSSNAKLCCQAKRKNRVMKPNLQQKQTSRWEMNLRAVT